MILRYVFLLALYLGAFTVQAQGLSCEGLFTPLQAQKSSGEIFENLAQDYVSISQSLPRGLQDQVVSRIQKDLKTLIQLNPEVYNTQKFKNRVNEILNSRRAEIADKIRSQNEKNRKKQEALKEEKQKVLIVSPKLIHTEKFSQSAYSMRLSPDNQILSMASYDRKIKIVRLADKEVLYEKEGRNAVFFSQDGQYVVSSDTNTNLIQIERLADKEVVYQYQSNKWVLSTTLSDDNQFLAIATSENNTVKVIRLADNKVIYRKKYGKFDLSTNDRSVTSTFITPDNQYLVLITNDKFVRVIRLSDGHEIAIHNAMATAKASLKNNNTWLLFAHGNNARIEQLDGTLVHDEQHRNLIYSVDLSKDNQYFITGSNDNTSRMIHIASKMIIHEELHSNTVTQAFLSDDNKYLVTADHSGHVRVTQIFRSVAEIEAEKSVQKGLN